jgi:epoxyqueuosine reductase
LAALAAELRRLGTEAGLDAIGFASAEPFLDARAHLESRKADGLHGGMHFTYGDPVRSTDPARSLDGARTLVVAARSYRKERLERESEHEPDQHRHAEHGNHPQPEPKHDAEHKRQLAPRPGRAAGRVARYSWRDEYAPLRTALDILADRLTADGYQAMTLVDDNALVDRAAAYRAGLGWFGKNANLLLPGQGSYFVLGSVVTDAPLPVNTTPAADGCGACNRCLPACPTGALIAPGVLDARRCLAWLLEAPGSFPVEYREALGGRIYGCDDCQEACPPNRAADRRNDPPAPPTPAPDEEPTVDLVALLDSTDDDLLARYQRWYIPKRQARYLRRNALVALGNVGDPTDPTTRLVVDRARRSPDPIVSEHADWAAARLQARSQAGIRSTAPTPVPAPGSATPAHTSPAPARTAPAPPSAEPAPPVARRPARPPAPPDRTAPPAR